MQLQAVPIFVIAFVLASNAAFRFDYFRDSNEDNDLELLCKDTTNGHPIGDANYYINTTRVLGQELLGPGPNGGHSYRITRDREGIYSCGVDESSSNEHMLVASPEVDNSIPTNYSTRVGENVTLVCPIPRGAMEALYDFRWIRNYNTLTSNQTVHTGFNESRFVLTILHTPASANGTFRCRVTVSPAVGNAPIKDAPVHLHVSAAVSPSAPMPPPSTPVAHSSEQPNKLPHTTALARPFPTKRPPPYLSNDDTGTVLSREILIAIIVCICVIIICVIVIAIPVVIIIVRAVVHRIHNRWAVNQIRENPELANTFGKLKACGADDGQDPSETQLQMEENREN